ncbi:MAG TPA: SRPBCC family protein [Cytophagales bacterium]|nr:SRPBCC family protein [Cytophagales bacterium]
MLIKIVIVIVAIIVLILVVALFTRKEYTLQKEVGISKPQHEVFNYVKMLKHQNEFNAWYKKDPNTKTEVRGVDGTVGSIYAWESEKNGKGEQETKEVVEGKALDYELRFIKPFEGKAYNKVRFEALDATQTRLTSTFTSSMKYPMNIMLLFINMDKMLGEDMATGLRNIKSNVEAK